MAALVIGAVMLGGCGSLLPRQNPQPGAGTSVANGTSLEATINPAVVCPATACPGPDIGAERNAAI